MRKNGQLAVVYLITTLDIIAANGLGVLVSTYVIGLPSKPILFTLGTALMPGVQLAFSSAIGHYWGGLASFVTALATVCFRSQCDCTIHPLHPVFGRRFRLGDLLTR